MENRCILVVDDDRSVLALISHVLRQAGYTVLSASDGRQALQVFSAHQAEVDLVVCDVLMPRMSGPELVEQLLARRADLPVVFLSAYSHTEEVRQQVVKRGLCFLPKPFPIGTLVSLTRNLLAARTTSVG